MRAPLLRILIAAGVVVAAALPAAAASAAPAEQNAMIRGAHLSPDTTNVDVYLTAFSGGTRTLWLSSVGYGDVSPYEWLKPGAYAVSMRPHGAAASTPAALSWTLTAKAGHAYTAAGIGLNKDLHGIIIEDGLDPPPAGHGLVRVIQAASRAPHADVTAQNGTVLARSVAFADTTPYTTLPAGNLKVTAKAAALNTTATVDVKSSSVSSVVLLDGQNGGLTLRAITDAAGAATRPIGSVPAGGGGTAPRPAQRSERDDVSWTVVGTAALLGGSVLAGGGLIARRRRRAVPA